MIESVSINSTIHGSELKGGGIHSRGGSQNTSGMVILDTTSETSSPKMLVMGYGSSVIL